LDDEPRKREHNDISSSILGYVGFKDLPDGNSQLEFDFSYILPDHQMDVFCFKSVDAIKAFMLKPENLMFASFPPSKFGIISNRRLFVGDKGLGRFFNDPDTPWAFSYPPILIFYGGNPEGLDVLKDWPHAMKTTLVRDCVAFITFGCMTFPSYKP
jgi:hypothetical protein